MTVPYRADVVGSLVGPPELDEARRAYAAGTIDAAAFKRVEDQAVDEMLAMQEHAGVDVVTDGELRRTHFAGPLIDACDGLESKPAPARPYFGPEVTLALDDGDLTRTIGTMFRKSGQAKFMEWPSAVYSMHPFDKVVVDGDTIGLSTWIGYSANEGKMLTLAVLDAEHAEPGTEVIFVWGEQDGGSAKPTVERHMQTYMRATVSPVPYAEVARKAYAPGGWRAA